MFHTSLDILSRGHREIFLSLRGEFLRLFICLAFFQFVYVCCFPGQYASAFDIRGLPIRGFGEIADPRVSNCHLVPHCRGFSFP